MNKELIIIGAMLLMLALPTVNNVSAQNVTTETSNAAENITATANQTASELGQNASEAGGDILNKTGEAIQNFSEGAASVLGNITQEIKEGVNGSK